MRKERHCSSVRQRNKNDFVFDQNGKQVVTQILQSNLDTLYVGGLLTNDVTIAFPQSATKWCLRYIYFWFCVVLLPFSDNSCSNASNLHLPPVRHVSA